MGTSLFRALPLLPGLRASTREWTAVLGSANAEHAAPFLRDCGQKAKAVQCPNGCGCAHEVVGLDDPCGAKAVCVCEDLGGCPDIRLCPEDADVFELNVEKLGREISRALNCRPLHLTLPFPALWQIGTWSDSGIPLLLTLQPNARETTRAVTECAARLGSRFILLASDIRTVDARSRELLGLSGLFDLNDILRPSAPGRFQPVAPPEELFAVFAKNTAAPEESGVKAAFALIERLDTKSPGKSPGLVTVFKYYCMDEMSALEIARKCRCSKTTVLDRLARIRKETGVEPRQFRRFSNQLEAVAEGLSDPRAAKVSRKHAIG